MHRRAFVLTIGALTLAASAAAAEHMKFVLYKDKAGEFRWRLKATNGEILATSGQGYKAKADAKKAIAGIIEDVGKREFDLYQDKAGEWRWRLKAKNGQIVAASSEGYKAKSDAEKAIQSIKDGAAAADTVEET